MFKNALDKFSGLSSCPTVIAIDLQYLVAELVARFRAERKPPEAITLTSSAEINLCTLYSH